MQRRCGEPSVDWGISPPYMPRGAHKPPGRDALVPRELQCAWEGGVEEPPPAHGSGMENQGLSELTHHFCRGEATRHLSRGTFRQGRENQLPTHPL